MRKPPKISKLFKSRTKMSIFSRKGGCSRKELKSVASQGHAEHAEHAEEFDKKTKNTPKIEVFGNFPPFLPQFGQNTPDFSTFLPLCDAPG